ncbi:MAG: UDP-N-acetylmuramoyl-tripeptide--D-alanyl-D-alanine ligase [Kiritimatiellae bacterium]|nr:UDP-N-acetylmuramoyl-tripeptide--D-alanyl-D-alanine ligase [Kiritimatiellia bacterium]
MRYTFDSREVKEGMGFVALKGDKLDGRDFIPAALKQGASEIIEGLEALQAKAREKRARLKAKVIGITGSAGKTTTKEMLKAFLSTIGKTHATEGNFNNHIGLPMTILNCPDDAEFLILEMGSNHLGEIASLCDIAAPDAGIVTSVGSAHLEFFLSLDGVAQEKGTLLESARQFAVVSSSNERLDALVKRCRAETIIVDTDQQYLADALAKTLPGKHNVSNAALAFSLAEKFGVAREAAIAALESFALPGSRWRIVEKYGATFIDDTYNANPDAMIAALDTFAAMPCSGRKIAILGDMFELGPDALKLHKKIFAHAMSLKLNLVIGIGEMSSQCLCNVVFKKPETLAKRLRVEVSAGDLVLLKASHSMNLGCLLG